MIPSLWPSELTATLASRIRRAAKRVLDVEWRAARRHDPIARHIQRALSVLPRGGVAHDTLQLESITARLTVAWTARRVHPWDRDLPSPLQDQAFTDLCLRDVDRVVSQVLDRFEAVDLLEVTVFHPDSHIKMLGGTICRSDFLAAQRLSIPMRLRMAGIIQEPITEDWQVTSSCQR